MPSVLVRCYRWHRRSYLTEYPFNPREFFVKTFLSIFFWGTLQLDFAACLIYSGSLKSQPLKPNAIRIQKILKVGIRTFSFWTVRTDLHKNIQNGGYYVLFSIGDRIRNHPTFGRLLTVRIPNTFGIRAPTVATILPLTLSHFNSIVYLPV